MMDFLENANCIEKMNFRKTLLIYNMNIGILKRYCFLLYTCQDRISVSLLLVVIGDGEGTEEEKCTYRWRHFIDFKGRRANILIKEVL
jgi:hypothetical protein